MSLPSLQVMDRYGIDVAVLSKPAPIAGVYFVRA
jgi:hypothetical protein